MAITSSDTVVLFRYKGGSSFFHRLPAWCKILLVFISSAMVFLLPSQIALLFSLFFFLTAVHTGFTLKEQITDLIPVFYYTLLLYAVTLGGHIYEYLNVLRPVDERSMPLLLYVLSPAPQDIRLCIRLVLVFQLTSFLFRTTTSLALMQGIGQIEICIRKILPVSKKPEFAELFSFFLLFIPRILEIWNSIEYAWKARRGKNGIKKILILTPVLISLCMHSAWQTSRAVRNRHQ